MTRIKHKISSSKNEVMDGEVTSEYVIKEQVAWTKASLDLYWISIEKWDALLGYYMEKKVIQSHEAVNIWFLQCNAFKRMEKNLIETWVKKKHFCSISTTRLFTEEYWQSRNQEFSRTGVVFWNNSFIDNK